MRGKDIIGVVKTTFTSFFEDKAMRLAAALAYYAIFSIGPLLFIILSALIAVVGWRFGEEAVRSEIYSQIAGIIGDNAARTIDSMVAARKLGTSPITTVLAVITLIIGASGVFGQLQDALNTIWEVKAKPGLGIMAFLRDRFLSMTMVLGLGFLLLVSMVLTTATEALVTKSGQLLPIPDVVTAILSGVVSFSLVTLLLAMIFKFLPDVKLAWSSVWAGAIVTAVLFVAGKFLLGLYLGREGTESAYGAAGSVVVILLWIYYASIILLLGAEFTQAYAFQRGHKLKTTKYAVPITAEARAQEGMSKPESLEPERGRVYARQTLGPASAAALMGPPSSPAFAPSAPANASVAKVFPWASLITAIGIGIATGYRITRDLKTSRV